MCTEERPEVVDTDDIEALRGVAQQLVQAIAAEPVPDRLRDLAIALDKALEQQRAQERAS